jgi:large repetitive protein
MDSTTDHRSARHSSAVLRALRLAPLLVICLALALVAPAQSDHNNTKPTASFTTSPSAPVAGERVTFTSTSTDPDGRIVGQAWDLDNDGSYDDGTATTASRTFAGAGTYRVQLGVMDNDGAVVMKSVNVVVKANGAPVAAFTAAPSSPETGQTITLNSTSSDPDGRPLAQEWDLDADGAYDDATGATASRSFADNGTRRVSLRVTDSGGTVRTTFRDIAVQNRRPTAAFGVSASEVDTGTAITFTSGSTDPDGTVASYRWDFDGNGTTDATGPTVSRSFSDNGTPTISLSVTDDDGATHSVSRQVTIRNRRPTAAFGVSAAEVDTGTAITFTSGSTDPDGTVASYRWDFDGNGTTDATGPTVSRSFSDNGTPTVSLSVTDDDGATHSVSRQVTIRNRRPTAAFGVSAAEVDTGTEITFTSGSTDPDGTVAAYRWDFDGNGTTDATNPTVTRSFSDDGVPAVSLSVTDDDGATHSVSRPVTIRNRAPSGTFTYGPAAPVAGEPVQLRSTATDSDGSVAQRSWDLDGDGAFDDATGAEVSTRFAVGGAHTVGLQVVDDDGVAGTPDVQTINVAARPVSPAVHFPSTVVNGAKPPAATLVGPRLLDPFPRVRIRGVTTRRGARIDLLHVSAPAGTKILVRCKGRACPRPRKNRLLRFGARRVPRLHVVSMPSYKRRYLPAGTVLEVFVTKKGMIGKYTRFRIRRTKPPLRTDRCTVPGVARARKCPA